MGKKLVKYSMVDAFTDSAYRGNPAAVCLLEEERDGEWLQAVAAEFNVSQTGYLTRIVDSPSPNPRFSLRWFTPVAEVKLCGHATLAASHTLFSSGLVDSDIIEFVTLSGILTAKKVPEIAQGSFFIELDFPTRQTEEYNSVDMVETVSISKALNGLQITDLQKTSDTDQDLFVVLASGEAVAEFEPQIDIIEKCPGRGLIISSVAPSGSGFDFYSRFFCPKLGIREDPVCGSAHCALATYWSKKLGKHEFTAYAASPRGGTVKIDLDEGMERVKLRGKAVTVMEGSILV